MFQANVGDSRAIACVNGKVEELSHDHKPTVPGAYRCADMICHLAHTMSCVLLLMFYVLSCPVLSRPTAEASRIYKAGGWVEFNRVNGKCQ